MQIANVQMLLHNIYVVYIKDYIYIYIYFIYIYLMQYV